MKNKVMLSKVDKLSYFLRLALGILVCAGAVSACAPDRLSKSAVEKSTSPQEDSAADTELPSGKPSATSSQEHTTPLKPADSQPQTSSQSQEGTTSQPTSQAPTTAPSVLGSSGSGPQAAVSMGGLDGSGGNVPNSTEEEILTSLRRVRGKMYRTFEHAYRLTFSDTDNKIMDQKTKTIVKAMALGNTTKFIYFVTLIESPSFEIVPVKNQNCHQSGVTKDASTDQKNVRICVNLIELSRLSPESLDLQIAALILHEAAHVYGFDEEDATHLQKYFLSNPILVLGLSVSQAPCLRKALSGTTREERLTEIRSIVNELDAKNSGFIFMHGHPPPTLEICLYGGMGKKVCVDDIIDRYQEEAWSSEIQPALETLNKGTGGALLNNQQEPPPSAQAEFDRLSFAACLKP